MFKRTHLEFIQKFSIQ